MEKAQDRKEYSRLWHLKNRERRLAARKQHYRNNREKILAQTKEYDHNHPEIRKKKERNYRAKHTDVCRERNRKYYHENINAQRERCRNTRKRLFAENKEAVLAYNRAWAARNKDKIRLRDLRRKALKAAAKVNLAGMQEWLSKIRSRQSFICYYCEMRKPISKLHVDHIIPLSKGGEHSVENLCAACSACNCSKQAKSINAWIRIGQQTLAL